jgi:ribosomal protein L24E
MGASDDQTMNLSRFLELFPSSDVCLDYLKERSHPDGTTCPKCRKKTKFHRLKSRPAYSCQYCGHQVYPTRGTIFERSTTSLQIWFWAIYLVSSTRCKLPAKQLQREIGVTQRTASKMLREIRALLGETA